MEFRDYVGVLRRAWPLILVLALVGAVIGLGAAELRRPTYEATSRAIVSTPPAANIVDLGGALTFGQQAVGGYADLATTALVLKPVITRLDLDTTPADLAKDLDVVAVDNQAALTVTAQASSPDAAAQLANAVTTQLASSVSDLSGGTRTGAASGVRLLSVDPAVAPQRAQGPQPWLLALAGLAIGVVLALAIALIRELLDTRVRTEGDLARITGAPVLGTTQRDQALRRRPLAVRDAATGRRAEDYRTLRTNLGFVELDERSRSVVVTSALEGEGKTTAAANLALAVADLGQRVLLVDGDLRRPGLADLFRVDGTVGLTDVLLGGATVDQAVTRPNGTAVDLLPAGTVPPNPNELVQSAAMDEFLDGAHERYDLVIIDSPPLLAVSDAAALSQRTGGTLLVSAANKVRRGQVDAALELLQRADARVLGVVLTMLGPRDADRAAGSYAQDPQGPRGTTARGSAVAAEGLGRQADPGRSAW